MADNTQNDAQRTQAAQDAQRKAAADRSADANRATNEKAQADRRATNERERAQRADRPQGVGGTPTPTQEENDKIRAGEMHIDDKQDDGSGPEPRFAMRRVDEDDRRGTAPYNTRQAKAE